MKQDPNPIDSKEFVLSHSGSVYPPLFNKEFFFNRSTLILGSQGLLGQSLTRLLRSHEVKGLLLPARKELDLTIQKDVKKFFAHHLPDYVFMAAGRVGGIEANRTQPAQFLFENLMIQLNVLQAAHEYPVKGLVFYGSACSYPLLASQPLKEESLFQGPPEPTNEAYATAKMAGLKLVEYYRKQYGDSFISIIPTNLYGPADHFDLHRSHVIPALFRKFQDAKNAQQRSVELWGTGNPVRDFLYVDDLALASVFLLQSYHSDQPINVGSGQGISVKELAMRVASVVGYQGELKFNTDKPDGAPVKILDNKKISALGWRPSISLEIGLKLTYEWFLQNQVHPTERAQRDGISSREK